MSSSCHPRLKKPGLMLIAGKCFPKDSGVNITPNLQVALKMQSQLFINDMIVHFYKMKLL